MRSSVLFCPVRFSPAPWQLLAAALIGGCGSSDSTIELADGTLVHVLTDRSADCHGCVQFEELAVLGDTAGPGYVEHTEYIIRDSSGNYWAGQYDDMIKVFDSAGNYVKQVGRLGEGPGEYQLPLPTFTESDGAVHVIDPVVGRETIVGPDFEVRDVRRFPPGMEEVAPLLDERRYVANGPYHRTTEGASPPLYIVQGAEIAASFGEVSAENPRAVYHRFREIATDPSGRIYTAWPFEYQIEAWSSDGRRITSYTGPSIYQREPSSSFSADRPPVTKIVALHADNTEHLWVLLWEASDDWLDHMREVTRTGGETILQPTDVQLIYTTRIDVIDLRSKTIIARAEPDQDFGMFLGDGSLVENRILASGVPQIAVWKVTLTP